MVPPDGWTLGPIMREVARVAAAGVMEEDTEEEDTKEEDMKEAPAVEARVDSVEGISLVDRMLERVDMACGGDERRMPTPIIILHSNIRHSYISDLQY